MKAFISSVNALKTQMNPKVFPHKQVKNCTDQCAKQHKLFQLLCLHNKIFLLSFKRKFVSIK